MKRFNKEEKIPSADELLESGEELLTLDEQLGEVEVELTQPIDIDGAPRDTLVLKSPNAGQIMEVLNVKRESDRPFVSLSKYCECSPTDLKKLHGRDISRLTSIVAAFSL